MRSWREALGRAYGAAGTLWLNTCLVLLAANLIAWVVHRRHEAAPNELGMLAMLFNRRVIEHVYPALGHDDVDLLMHESVRDMIYEPFTEYTLRPLRGRFVTFTDAGYRWSRDQGPWPTEARFYNVFLFGGSTLFGVGIADGDTVASYLQPLLAPVQGRDVRVYNFGRSGYYSSQERILLENLLAKGVVPDAAVFIDGLNDFRSPDDMSMFAPKMAACTEAGSGSPWLAAIRTLPLARTANHVARLLGLATGPVDPMASTHAYDDPGAADGAIERYLRNKRSIEGVAAAYGFPVAFVWQPVPGYRYPPGKSGHWLMGGLNGYSHFGYPRMAERVATQPPGADFLWCADLGADGDEMLYVDPVHYSPIMSERVARCIADGLRERGLLRGARPAPVDG